MRQSSMACEHSSGIGVAGRDGRRLAHEGAAGAAAHGDEVAGFSQLGERLAQRRARDAEAARRARARAAGACRARGGRCGSPCRAVRACSRTCWARPPERRSLTLTLNAVTKTAQETFAKVVENRNGDAGVIFAIALPRVHDYDWLVIGSGFGGSVSALRLSEQGHRVGVLESGRRFADHELPQVHLGLAQVLLRAEARHEGHPPADRLQGRLHRQRRRVGGGSLGYANTLYRAPRRFYDDPQWAGLSDDWGAELGRTTTRRSACSASPTSPRTTRPTTSCASSGASWAWRTRTPRRASASTSATRWGTRTSVATGPERTPCTHVRALHGRLPGRREEHAGQELPVVRRAQRRADRSPSARSSTSARCAARRRLRGRLGAHGRVAAQGPPHPHHRRRRRRRRRARHEPAAAALPPRRRAAADSAPASASSCARTRSRC